MSERTTRNSSLKRKASLNLTFASKRVKKTSCKKLISILQKNEEDRTPNEKQMILDSNDSISVLKERLEKINAVKSRNIELEDDPNVLEAKCKQLANAIRNAKHVVVYTGAGISTAAKIPDYRGTKGIWTLLQQGKDIGNHDLSLAEPTLTHMALYQLYRHGLVKHVVSQNCDDLHLRSGLPRKVLSEVHGNMSVEVCAHCEPVRYFWRVFDVTEHTGRYAHMTARKCPCGEPLLDTIIHFGEKGVLLWPLNWDGANKNADKADLILCVGSSLKVLRKYGWIWGLDRPKKERPQLFIINLQWTPKDDQATLKINGKCDVVFTKVMSLLNIKIPPYEKLRDPIFYHSSPIIQPEYHTVRKPMLEIPESEYFEDYSNCEKLLQSFRDLEDYQNTTVFIKEEDEIKVKEENDYTLNEDFKQENANGDVYAAASKLKVENNRVKNIEDKKSPEADETDLKKDVKENKITFGERKNLLVVEDSTILLEIKSEHYIKKEINDEVPSRIKDSVDDFKISPSEELKSDHVRILNASVKTEADSVEKELNETHCNVDCKEKIVSELEVGVADSRIATVEVLDKSSLVISSSKSTESNLEIPDINNKYKVATQSNIKSILKNFRMTKKCDRQSSGITDSVPNATLNYLTRFSEQDSPSLSNLANSNINTQNVSNSACNSSEKSTDTALTNSNTVTPSNGSSSQNASCLTITSLTSSPSSSTSTLSKDASSTSFSTLISSSHSKCECLNEMDAHSRSYTACFCVNQETGSSPGDILQKVELNCGGVGQRSIVAIVKPLPSENNRVIGSKKLSSESLAHTCEKPFVNNTLISSNCTQENFSINVSNQGNHVIGASFSQQPNLSSSPTFLQPLIQPVKMMHPTSNLLSPVIKSQCLPHLTTSIVQQQIPNPSLATSVVQQQIPNPSLATSVVQQQILNPSVATSIVQHQILNPSLATPLVQQQIPIPSLETPLAQQQISIPSLPTPIVQQQILNPKLATQIVQQHISNPSLVTPIFQQHILNPSLATPIVQQQIPNPCLATSIFQQQIPNPSLETPLVQQQISIPSVPTPVVQQQILNPNIATSIVQQQILNPSLPTPVVQQQIINSNLATPIVPQQIPNPCVPTLVVQQQIPNPSLATSIVQQQIPNPSLATSMVQQQIPNASLATSVDQQQILNPNLSTSIVQQQILSPSLPKPIVQQHNLNTSLATPIVQQQLPNASLSALLLQQQILNSTLGASVFQQHIVSSLPSFLQQQILHQAPFYQQLLPNLANGTLPPNIFASPLPLTPFLPGIGGLQSSPQLLPQPLGLFPDQPLLYLQPVPLNTPVSSSHSSFPSTLPSIPMPFPPSLIQGDTKISNISLSTNCVPSTLDTNPSSLSTLRLDVDQISLNASQVLNQGQSKALSQLSSSPVTSMTNQSAVSSVLDSRQVGCSESSTVSGNSITLQEQASITSSTSVQPANKKTNSADSVPTTVSSHQSCSSNENNLSKTPTHQLDVPSINYQGSSTHSPPSNQFRSPNRTSPIIRSPQKSPSSPRVLNPFRSPISPLSSPTSPRRIRTIRPFQFKNELSIPEDLIFEHKEEESVPKHLNRTEPNEDDTGQESAKASALIIISPSISQAIFYSHTMPDLKDPEYSNSNQLCLKISNEESLEEAESLKPEENAEGEGKKRGRKPKANKEEKQEEVYHYSLPQQCEFCARNYASQVCMFYERQSSLTLTGRKKTTYCNCCTYMKKTDEVSSLTVLSGNPGWFGKGCRKNLKKKRSI